MKGKSVSDYNDKQVRSDGLTEREMETLPNWAQERLADLRSVNSRLKQENNGFKAQDGAAPERSAVSYGDVENDPQYLPDGSFDVVRYTLGKGHVDIRLKVDGLELEGSDDLGFTPQAVNVIRVHLND